MIQLNVTSLTELTRLFLPSMQEKGTGGILNVSSTGDSAVTPISLTRGYSYPVKYPLRFEIPSEGHHAGDTTRVRIVVDSLPVGLTSIEAILSATNPDMTTYLYTKSINTISFASTTTKRAVTWSEKRTSAIFSSSLSF